MSVDPTRIEIEFDPTVQRMRGISRHGHVPFDVPFISELAPNLWQGGCEDGLVLPKFIKHVVSLYPWEHYEIEHQISSMLVVLMYDSEDQDFSLIDSIARWVNGCRQDGPVLVYCQAGLNRSSLVAVRALCMEGMNSSDAIDLLRSRRSPACLCNPAFERWLRQ